MEIVGDVGEFAIEVHYLAGFLVGFGFFQFGGEFDLASFQLVDLSLQI